VTSTNAIVAYGVELEMDDGDTREIFMNQPAIDIGDDISKSGPEYDHWLGCIQRRAAAGPLFTTDASGLWEAYLASFTGTDRQFHNCSACRHFIERWGGLVRISEDGRTESAIWGDAPFAYSASEQAMLAIIRKAKVTGVFLSNLATVGTSRTDDWTHFSIEIPRCSLHTSKAKNAGQAMAEKAEDHKNVMRALAEFGTELLGQALTLLKSEALYRAEHVIGPAQWLADLHAASAKGHRSNVVWRAIATAPAGFCHPRASMIGSLLEDLERGLPFDEVSRRFRDKMSPLQYQRPQVAPAAATIKQAEELVERLGIARSLERRFARLDEIQAIWRPVKTEETSGGVFAHLKPKDAKTPKSLELPEQTITWEKFARTVLPDAKSIDVMVPSFGSFMAIVTATHDDAPPILQWDSEEKRNPFSMYTYVHGSMCRQWGLTAGEWRECTAAILNPAHWNEGHDHHGRSAFLLLSGAADSRDSGLALFPEILKSDLHAVRSVIEAHSNTGKISGRESASACGIFVVGQRVRVHDALGNLAHYRIDRWD